MARPPRVELTVEDRKRIKLLARKYYRRGLQPTMTLARFQAEREVRGMLTAKAKAGKVRRQGQSHVHDGIPIGWVRWTD